MSRAVVQRVEALARPLVEAMGLELVEVEYVREGGSRYLRLIIDKEGGITLDDCKAVSLAVEPKLDEEDPVQQSYHFEVSSPGVERPVKRDADFARFAGRMIRVTTFAPVDGQRSVAGELLGLRDGMVYLRVRPVGKEPAREIQIPRGSIAKANLHCDF